MWADVSHHFGSIYQKDQCPEDLSLDTWCSDQIVLICYHCKVSMVTITKILANLDDGYEKRLGRARRGRGRAVGSALGS